MESGRDRRKAENSLLRELVDALKDFIAARDAIWALNPVDRIFRKQKCRRVFADYEQAAVAVKAAIGEMAKANIVRQSGTARFEPLISLEEFEALMSTPGSHHPKTYAKRGKTVAPPLDAEHAHASGDSPAPPAPDELTADGLSMLEHPFSKRGKLV